MVHQTMNTSSASAARASSTISHMRRSLVLSPAIRAAFILGMLSGVLAGCAAPERLGEAGAPVETARAAGAAPVAPAAPAPGAVRSQAVSRWVAAPWSDLPGWGQDSVLAAWPALLRGCERPAEGWAAACASARALAAPDEARVRAWLQAQLQPWRVEAPDGAAQGLITGYYEPLIEASRQARPGFQVPIYTPPDDLATRRPWFTRTQIDTDPAARAKLRGREIAWLADPLDALVLHIQGSGRLALTEPDGSRRLVRAAFAGHNDQPYQSIGRWLVERGAFTLDEASWPAIKAWARANPKRVGEMLAANPRYVFFREQPLPDPSVGPLGAAGVPLTPGRSIAVDKGSLPYGTPVWVATTEPQPWAEPPPAPRPLQRLMLAQDTGGAITGAVRADYFWGWGDGADEFAGRMKQPLRMWALWPKAGS